MMGFPTAFTLMGLGMVFGFTAFYNPAEPWLDNRVFNLMVQRTSQVSDSIFSTYLLPFEVLSVLLLAALIGAIVLARRD
jgi:NADH:ubiquinone oxidoreductase subunit 6 (subunit J)